VEDVASRESGVDVEPAAQHAGLMGESAGACLGSGETRGCANEKEDDWLRAMALPEPSTELEKSASDSSAPSTEALAAGRSELLTLHSAGPLEDASSGTSSRVRPSPALTGACASDNAGWSATPTASATACALHRASLPIAPALPPASGPVEDAQPHLARAARHHLCSCSRFHTLSWTPSAIVSCVAHSAGPSSSKLGSAHSAGALHVRHLRQGHPTFGKNSVMQLDTVCRDDGKQCKHQKRQTGCG